VLAPDLVVDFGCATIPRADVISTFLSVHGFTSFDEERERRERGKSFFALQINAYDQHRMMVEVIGLRKPKSYGSGVNYRLTITSPPPTVHDHALEDAAVRLVRDTLACQLHAVNRFENRADSVAIFNAVFEDEQRRMRGTPAAK
jgi:hypothetical protein